MKLLIELEIEVDGKISEERLTDVVLSSFPACLTSECFGDGSDYCLWVKSAEVKEVK